MNRRGECGTILSMTTAWKQDFINARRELVRRQFQNLNDRQQEAVMATEGPLLILAGAGSGKTTVLINRIANLLKFGRASDCDELPEDLEESEMEGDPIIWRDGMTVTYMSLSDDSGEEEPLPMMFCFVLNDVFGEYELTDLISFEA